MSHRGNSNNDHFGDDDDTNAIDGASNHICMGFLGDTYIHLKTNGYMLAAVCTTLFTTAASSFGFSIMDFRFSKMIKLIVSLEFGDTMGFANVSARKSAPHLRSSTRAEGPMMGSMPCII